MMTKHLSMDEYGTIAAEVLDVPAQDLLATCDTVALLAALDAPAAGTDSYEVYPNMAAKASALVYRLCHTRPLLDGNQRAAFMALHEYLARNMYEWTGHDEDDAKSIAAVLKEVAGGNVTEKELTDWISARIGGLE
jgi:prophage maintenance system killer protein